MASTTDTKRQSTGNKVATPRITPTQGPTEVDNAALVKAIRARVKLKTTSPTSTLEGTIYTTDHNTNMIAIACPPSTSSTNNQAKDYHIIPISRIQSFTILSLSPSSSSDIAAAIPPVGKVDVKALKAREDAAVQKLKESEARRGKGVGKEAQEVFDALSRTLPVRWANLDIIINDNIKLQPPYTPQSCVAPSTTPAASLAKVKLYVENARKNITGRWQESSNASEAAAAGNGKTTSGTGAGAGPGPAQRKGG